MSRIDISIVAPCFNEEEVIDEFVERIYAVLSTLDYSFEIIIINDGSTDSTLKKALGLSKERKEIKIIDFSRNFGHQAAVTAGLDNSCGEAAVIIDVDLQDPPEVIPEMIKKWKEGYDVVYGKRISREGESKFKLLTARIFYRIFRILTDKRLPVDTGDFRLMDKKVVTAISPIRETHRFLRGLISWIGFKQYALEYHRKKRVAGKTHYPLKKMVKFSLDAILSFSIVPLRIITLLGAMTVIITLFFVFLILFVRIFVPNYFIPGFSATIVFILLFGGLQLFSTGLIGEYIGRIYEESKKRPLYIIDSKYNFENKI